MKLKIGNVELENNLILAPMAGVTDLPFRAICKKYGNPGLVCNEMVSSKAICYNDEKTLNMLEHTESERPISMQLFGHEPEFIGEATQKISQIADIIDFNMGCPAPKVVKNGDGSRILTDISQIPAIVESLVKNTDKPVTVKIRKGWDSNNIVAVEAAKMIEEAGASAIIVHGRTRDEFYTGHSDWSIIKQVKQAVKIPVIGNGDINSEEDAKKMLEETGCDGLMVGRGALGNPWIFARINYYLETGNKMPEIAPAEKLQVIKEHFNLLLDNKGEYVATREIRKFISWYVKGLPNASYVRDKINQVESRDSFMEIIEEYFNTL